MTTAVTKESLAARIAELESGARSLKEDYTLAAYKMLLATMEAEPVYQVEGTVEKDENGQVTKLEWVDVPYSVAVRAWDEFGLLTRTLYKSPPAPVVPDDVASAQFGNFQHYWHSKGYVLVPTEPTESMCDISHIGVDVYCGITDDNEYYSIGGAEAAKVWKAMLAAAPKGVK